jgi:hypothetical protein
MSGVIPKTQVCRRVELNDEDNASMHTTTLHHRGEYKIHVERVVSHDPPAVAGATWIKVIFLNFIRMQKSTRAPEAADFAFI